MQCGTGGVSAAMNARHDAPWTQRESQRQSSNGGGPGRRPVKGGQGGDAGERTSNTSLLTSLLSLAPFLRACCRIKLMVVLGEIRHATGFSMMIVMSHFIRSKTVRGDTVTLTEESSQRERR